MATNRTWTLVTGAGIGAGVMYFLDPNGGRRRRALARDRCQRAWRRSGDVFGTTTRNLRDRVQGLAAEVRSRSGGPESVSDDVLVARVRSRLGRVLSHPHAVTVSAQDGMATLSGPVFESEVPRLLAAVQAVKGVKSVENRLEPHQQADIPALQGGVTRQGGAWEITRRNWSPSLRLAVAAAGSGITAFGTARGGALGLLGASAGAGMLARALTNMDFRRMLGADPTRQSVQVRKTMHIDAPVEDVYRFWSQVENFPRFMTRIKEVRNMGEGRSHWVARGPAGLSMQWDAAITRDEPNRSIEWRSQPGGAVRNNGAVRFQPNARGGTQVDIDMWYTPPGGALGHAFAAIFGADPKRAMDEDLIRLKSLLEFDKTRVEGGTVTRDELRAG